jgi:hypothetical protein
MWANVYEWSEESRYLTGQTFEEVELFLTSLNEILLWLEKRL